MVIKIPQKEQENTIGDRRRWQKHMPVKIFSRSDEYRENYGRINWRVKRADSPFPVESCVVGPNIGEEPE